LKLAFSEIVFIGRLLCLVGLWLSALGLGGKGKTLRWLSICKRVKAKAR